MEAKVQYSLFEKIGGMPAIDAAVGVFYQKVIADDRVNSFFQHIDMEKQSHKLKTFLAYAFGAPMNYTGKSMHHAHSHMVDKGLNDTHFDAVMEHLGATLQELNVEESLIQEAAKIAESTRNHVLGRISH